MLDRFRNGDRTPVGVGSHRKTEAVMVPVEVYDELVAERTRSVAQAIGSLNAEGLTASAEAAAITEQWARGEIKDSARLSQIEADLTLARLNDLGLRILPGSYDLQHLQALHRELFGDIHPWAGEIRTVSLAKTDLF